MSEHTPGPWRWEVNLSSRQIRICGGVPRFDLTVMDLVRWGMNGAAPRFREIVDGTNIMHRADKWSAIVPGRKHHEDWFRDLDHPDARLIVKSPDMRAACEAVDQDPGYWSLSKETRDAIRRALDTDIFGSPLSQLTDKAEGERP